MTMNAEQVARPAMPVWVWPTAALAAMFFANAVPHTVAGLLVLDLPTPFSGGPGTLSSPLVNTYWGLSNIVAGLVLTRLIWPWRNRPALRWTMILAAFALVMFVSWAIGSRPLPGRFG